MIWIIGILIYWTLGFFAYILTKRWFVKEFGPSLGRDAWTPHMARKYKVMCFVSGPIALVSFGIFLGLAKD